MTVNAILYDFISDSQNGQIAVSIHSVSDGKLNVLVILYFLLIQYFTMLYLHLLTRPN